DGTVFRYDVAKGKLTVLHTFAGSDGQYPEHGVVRDKAGNLYGVTAFGGADDEGAVYEIAKDGTFSTLHSFSGGTDGGFLYGGLAIDKEGNLIGSTVSGGANGQGTVFVLEPDGTLLTVYNFTGGTDGGGPEGDMLLKGASLYSTVTSGGDEACNCGGVYEVTSKAREKMLHPFTAATGDNYSAGLTAKGGTFYGTTQSGGSAGLGVVFSLTKK
ncbi:MAG TPA: choice-of-anchor tandem repeat GloVer-containing protein, partial [Rhizomicrobium sp.]|nr:choice-of-anchor tandem repeat GloVer-containing protein [Rhizomicrobium sp.]